MIRLSSKSLIRSLVRTWNKYLGYTTTARYDSGEVFVHYSGNWEQALDWARQYPAGCTIVVSQYLSTQVTVRIA